MNARTARRGIVGTLFALLLTGLVVVGLGLHPADAADHARRAQLLELTNTDRVERDRDRLSLNEKLSRYAKHHSREMAQKGFLFHSTSDQLIHILSGYRWSLGGENVGAGGSLDGVEEAFMRSSEHRHNVLDPRSGTPPWGSFATATRFG